MRQAALLGNPNTKRTVYLERAAAEAGISFHLMDWRNWKTELPWTEGFLKIDPPLWESCSLEELEGLTGDYLECLETLSQRAKEQEIEFLNHPTAIAALLDKRECKNRLREAGLSVTEELTGGDAPGGAGTAGRPSAGADRNPKKRRPKEALHREKRYSEGAAAEFFKEENELKRGKWSVEGLMAAMREERISQVFIKPVRGSGAAGVSAFRWQPSLGRMVLYTCAMRSPEYGLINTKRLRHFTDKEEILPLLDRLLAMDCIVERWYAKAEYQGFSYDLRAVVQDGRMDFILARLSKGPITNLHLNNHPLEAAALGLPGSVLEAVFELCEKSMECCQGLRSAGIDILLEKGSLRPRIIEMNAQGDLIYQDIYHDNKIYRHQTEMIKNWMEGGRCSPEQVPVNGSFK